MLLMSYIFLDRLVIGRVISMVRPILVEVESISDSGEVWVCEDCGTRFEDYNQALRCCDW